MYKRQLQRLTEAAEKAKVELSNATQSEINLPFITATPEGPKHLDLTLTRAKFEELASKLIDRCAMPVEQALKDAKLSSGELDEIVMGGWFHPHPCRARAGEAHHRQRPQPDGESR